MPVLPVLSVFFTHRSCPARLTSQYFPCPSGHRRSRLHQIYCSRQQSPDKNDYPSMNEKGSKNLITTRKHCVYKAFGAYKTNYEIWTENFAYIPICAATSAAKSSFFFSSPSPVSKRTNLFTFTGAPASLES